MLLWYMLPVLTEWSGAVLEPLAKDVVCTATLERSSDIIRGVSRAFYLLRVVQAPTKNR